MDFRELQGVLSAEWPRVEWALFKTATRAGTPVQYQSMGTGEVSLSDGKAALPRVLNQRSAKRLLEEHGWVETMGGKHVVKMDKQGYRPITLPHHHGDDYSKGLTSAILRQAGLKGPEQDTE